MTHRPVVVAPIAELALADAAASYEGLRTGFADLFLNSFQIVADRISQFPESGPAIEPGVRRARFPEPFSYWVLYQLTPAAIEVVDVLPMAADPARWLAAALRST